MGEYLCVGRSSSGGRRDANATIEGSQFWTRFFNLKPLDTQDARRNGRERLPLGAVFKEFEYKTPGLSPGSVCFVKTGLVKATMFGAVIAC